jgi:predicted RNase H-like nuclease
MRHVGVDGCRSGWLAVTRGESALEYRVFSQIDELALVFSAAERIFVDVPIGLPWFAAPIRPCDRLARNVLGVSRKSSVFPVPCRQALAADGLDSARRTNQREIGRSVGAQTWGISPKIAEVDRFLLATGGQTRNIREVHPEVCFWALADRKPMQHKKKTAEGRAERVSVLARYETGIQMLMNDALSNTHRKDLHADDLLDAAVAFVTAEARIGVLDSLAGAPTHDQAGLPIEMLYLRTWEE